MAAAARAWLQKRSLQLVRCDECSMIYANPVPEEFASGQYYDEVGAGYYLSESKLQSDYAPVRFERELRIFREHCDTGEVLDVGCSSGAFLHQLNHRWPGAYQILGADVSGPALDYAEKQGIPIVRGNFLNQDFGSKEFQAITFWAVLEHLLTPGEFLEKAASLLASGGICFVLVPNMSSLAVRLAGQRYRYIYPQHLNYFTAETLRRLVESRFSLLTLRSTHFNPIVIWQDWWRGGKEVSNAERGALLSRTTAYKQNSLLKPLSLAYKLLERGLGTFRLADNLVAVLRKKLS
jgi:2-polyprenyl-3-methyl-5-hydroxy-6-metoxy-1,4-benzoquinol methylase